MIGSSPKRWACFAVPRQYQKHKIIQFVNMHQFGTEPCASWFTKRLSISRRPPMPANTPIPFTTYVEMPSEDEAQTVQGLKETLRAILDTTSKDYGSAIRAVHAKGHGLVRGRLTILNGLAPDYAQGLFAQGGSYEAILRFSTAPGDILEDAVSAPRGVGLKILGVP